MLKNKIPIEFLSTISNQDLYIKLIEQLNKDFQMAGIDVSFSEKSQPIELIGSIQKTIVNLMSHQFTDYLNLLYRIDIPEQDLKNTTTIDIETLSKQVAFLILKREWQKVYIRNKF